MRPCLLHTSQQLQGNLAQWPSHSVYKLLMLTVVSKPCRKDAWAELRPGEVGYTYDGKANPMLGPYNRLQNRLDRVLLRSRDWVVSSIHMVGQEAIPGVTYEREYKRGNKRLPVLPSDHFGLYAVMKPSS